VLRIIFALLLSLVAYSAHGEIDRTSNPRLFADCEVYASYRATEGEGATSEELQAITRCGAYITGAFDLLQFRNAGECSLTKTSVDDIVDEYLAYNRKVGVLATHRAGPLWKVTDACHCSPDPDFPKGICKPGSLGAS